MSVSYWVLCSDELMDAAVQWPEGLRPVRAAADVPPSGGGRWWLFEDDGAPATLDGRQVELTFARAGNGVQIATRKPAT